MFYILFFFLHVQQNGMKANVLALFSLVILNFVVFKTRNHCSNKARNPRIQTELYETAYTVDGFPNVPGSLCCCSCNDRG
jgi:hypothetical protein